MNTRDIATEYRLQHWAGIMHERKESGLSVRAFCENAGFHENRYYYWQKRLREAACEKLSITSNERTEMMPPGFVEAKLSERPTQHTMVMGDSAQVSIETAGLRISASGDYSAEKLAVLLREMRRPC